MHRRRRFPVGRCIVSVLRHQLISSRVADIRDSVSKIWDNPLLSAYLVKTHDLAVDEMYRLTKPDAKRKKQLEKTFSASAGEDAESVKELKSCLEGVGISSYG